MKIGVTGANGFVGKHLCAALKQAGHDVTALVRSPGGLKSENVDTVVAIPGIGADSDLAVLKAALADLDVVVHLAAKVHVMNGGTDEAEFRNVNVDGTARLYEAAAAAGVKRFVFMSSVKAAAERSTDVPVTAETAPGPEDAYGRSKRDAENRLSDLADRGCTLVILRPVFVYGWPPAGNFRTVINAVLKGVPLPIAGIDNRRDMIYVGNLCDAVRAACDAQGLAQTPYFIADGTPVSTPELFRMTARAFARPSRLFYAPVWLLRLAGKLTGRSAAIARITENFVVDCSPFHRDAGWQAPYKMSDGLRLIAQAWTDENRAGSNST